MSGVIPKGSAKGFLHAMPSNLNIQPRSVDLTKTEAKTGVASQKDAHYARAGVAIQRMADVFEQDVIDAAEAYLDIRYHTKGRKQEDGTRINSTEVAAALAKAVLTNESKHPDDIDMGVALGKVALARTGSTNVGVDVIWQGMTFHPDNPASHIIELLDNRGNV